MQNLLEQLKTTLQNDERLVVDGNLVKNKIVELALAMDAGLLALLLGNETIKKQFFKQVGGVLVFDKVALQSFVSNKQFLPDSYTAFKNKIGLTANGEYLTESREVVLAWPYKDCTLEGGQTKEEQKRKEIFWNETLAADEIDRLLDPKVLTHFKKYDKDGEHKVARISLDDNLIIKGNNLLALHSLKKQYAGKVKLIYIDPPFNTERDSFTYNDSFNHSTWLTFMRSRLLTARNILSIDGNIFIHVDNNESHYMKVMLDEIFGRSNFVNEIIWHKGREGGSSRSHSKSSSMPTEYQNIFIYAKDRVSRYWVPPLGPYKISTISRIEKDSKGWFYTRGRMGRTPAEWELEAGTGLKTYVSDRIDLNKEKVVKLITAPDAKYVVLGDVWGNTLIKNSKEASYDTAKPESLLKIIIEAASEPGDIVLDFFLGSGTTAVTSLKLGRTFIGVEQLEGGIKTLIPRLHNVVKGNDNKGISKSVNWQGGDSFTYCELAQHNANVIDKIEQAKTTQALTEIWHKIENADFISYKIKPEVINKNIHEFAALSVAEQKQFLISVLDKNQLYVNYSEIDDVDYQISDEDKALNRQFYGD